MALPRNTKYIYVEIGRIAQCQSCSNGSRSKKRGFTVRFPFRMRCKKLESTLRLRDRAGGLFLFPWSCLLPLSCSTARRSSKFFGIVNMSTVSRVCFPDISSFYVLVFRAKCRLPAVAPKALSRKLILGKRVL